MEELWGELWEPNLGDQVFYQDPITDCDENNACFSNKCFGDEDEEKSEDGSGSGSGPTISEMPTFKKWCEKRTSIPFGPWNGFGGSGSGAGPWEKDANTSEDDSKLDGPIDVESIVSSDK